MEEGFEKGLEKGRAEGRAEGIEIGLERGLEKGLEKALLAFLKKNPGWSDEEVATTFEVSTELVQKVRGLF